MPRYVLTGAPGAGKTAVVRALECAGHRVVEEAATDVIALAQALGQPAPESSEDFLDKITSLQRQRQLAHAPAGCGLVFFDRSPVCTVALARFLGLGVPPSLTAEIDRILDGGVYERRVFFARSLGFVQPTAARRIGLADSLEFEKVHEQTYRELGFDLIEVPAAAVPERLALIAAAVGLRGPAPAG
jgi:predicted ATPase